MDNLCPQARACGKQTVDRVAESASLAIAMLNVFTYVTRFAEAVSDGSTAVTHHKNFFSCGLLTAQTPNEAKHAAEAMAVSGTT